MITIAWNCQGLGNTLTVRHLRDISSQYAPQVYFLMETKQQRGYMEQICKDLKCHDLITVEPVGASGGLALLWTEDVEVSMLSTCDRWIEVAITWQNKSFILTGLYGDPVVADRGIVWQQIIARGEARTEPWIMCGDFNEIYSNNDKRGGRLRPESSFLSFRTMLDRCGLLEPPLEGNPLSWFGKRGDELVHCKLDRVVANVDAFLMFPAVTTYYLPRIGSDHSPVLTKFIREDRLRKGHFRYDSRWVDKEGFRDAIHQGWVAEVDVNSNIIQRIRSCRNRLAIWKKTTNTNSRLAIKNLKFQLDKITHEDSMNWDVYQELKNQLALAYNEEELYWKSKSRAHWLKGGDRNSKFFHASVKQKRCQNKIKCLMDEQTGVLVYSDKEMGSLACSFYSQLYTSELIYTTNVRSSPMFTGVDPKVTSSQNLQLIRPATDGEIKMAAFSMNPEKCAGPDGFSGSFYQKNWAVVGTQVCALVREFMESGEFDNRLNETSICLIPKKQRPTRLTEFRPISLCNFVYKIISKILSTRLKAILPSIISETQAAFVEGRLISDNILLAHEILHSLKVNPDMSDSCVALKTDMMKAFDRVEWQFLEDSLQVLGFHTQWIAWIMQCVTTVSYGVLVNGRRYGNFTPSRGLRQGDPLSPFLFILCTEILILRLNKDDPHQRIEGVQIASSAPSVSHLFFADDSLFFSSVENNQLQILKSILNDYEEASGQRVNLDKSSIIYGPKMSLEKRTEVRRITGITQDGGKGIYLGMPETFLGSKTATLSFLEERVRSRIGSWKNRYLSQGGKEILLKAVAQAIPAYVMSCYLLPKGLINKITADFAHFWWRKQDTGKGIHWQSWDRLARPKEEGGLNFRHLDGFNLALLGKQLWRICTQPETLLARTLKAKYFPREATAYHAKVGNRPSFGWRSVMESKKLLELGLKKEFGNGEHIDLWRDPWLIDTIPRGARVLPNVQRPSLELLKEQNSDQWRLDSLPDFFDAQECHRIQQIKPGGAESMSSFSWIYNESGVYSVKSGYWLWSNSKFNQYLAPEPKPNFSPIYTKIWQVEASNKVRNFLWRCTTFSIPVGYELRKKTLTMDASCTLCGHEKEDVNHLLFKCDLAREVWSLSSLAEILAEPSESLQVNMWRCLTYVADQGEDVSVWPWIMWCLWKARNEFVFQRKTTNSRFIMGKARADAAEWRTSQDQTQRAVAQLSPTSTATDRETQGKWEPPPNTFLKCNVDAAWQESHDVCGVAWILRDQFGRVKLHGIKTFPRLLSALETEATALVWAVRCMWNMGYDRIIFESDSSNLIKALAQSTSWPRLHSYTTEIHGIVARRPWEVQFQHISRSKNGAADSLAKHALLFHSYFGSIDNLVFSWLQPSLEL